MARRLRLNACHRARLVAALLLASHVTSAAVTAVWHSGNIIADANSLFPLLQRHRRELHKIPELGFEETRTSTYLQRELTALNITFQAGIAGTGIIARIGSGLPIVALRSDIDALPIRVPSLSSQHSAWFSTLALLTCNKTAAAAIGAQALGF